MHTPLLALASGLVLFVAPPAIAAAPQILVAEGDVLAGAGTVTDVTDLAIDVDGHWAASVALDGTTTRHALLLDGAVLVGPNSPLPGLPAHTLRGAGSLAVVAGEPIWIATDVAQAAPNGVGAYLGTTPLVVVGQPLAGAGVPAGAIVGAVHQIRAVTAGHYLVGLSFAVGAGPAESLLARFVEQPGGAFDVTAVVKSGDTLAGYPWPVVSLDPSAESLATNVHGEPVFVARMLDSETVVFRGTTVVAGPGAPAQAPPQQATWAHLDGAPVALNASGHVLVGGGGHGASEYLSRTIDAPQLLAVTNKLLPLLHPYGLERLFTGHAPGDPHPAALHFSASDQPIWFAGWDAPDTEPNLGLLRGSVVQFAEGHVLAGGLSLPDFLPPSAFEIGPVWACDPPASQFVVRAGLSDGRIAAVRLVPKVHVAPVVGCTPHASALLVPGQLLEPGSTLALYMTDPPSMSALAMVALSTAPAAGTPPCGVDLPGLGELLVSLAPHEWFATVASTWPAFVGFCDLGVIPSDDSLAGLIVHAQGLWVDPTAGAAEPIRLASGARIQFGP